jgi:single-strand DNA-binding protein
MSGFPINRLVLVGRLTKDPVLRVLPSGSSVCWLRVACSSFRRDEEGAYNEKSNFFEVSVFGAQAENVQRFTRKGHQVAIDGRLTWSEWESYDQRKQERVSIIADTVKFLHAPGENPEISEPQDEEPRDDEPSDVLIPEEEFDLVGVGGGSKVNYLVY